MKKISLYLLLALVGILTTACNGDYKDWADPQSYAPEDAVTIPGFTASSVGTIDVAALTSDTAKLFTLSTATLPEGYTLGNARIILVPQTETASSAYTYSTDTEGNCPTAADGLQEMVKNDYGLRPIERAYKGQVLVNAVKDGQAILINAGTIDLNVIPEAPVIEDAYYITGTCNGWDNSNTDFELSNGGADPYENPVFTCMVPAEKVDGDLNFKVTPKSGLGAWAKQLCNDDNNPGKFVGDNAGSDFKFAAVAGAKFYKVSFDMLAYTWSVEALNFAEYIYEIGNSQSWTSCIPMRNTQDGKYVGFAYLDGEFKFKPNENNWDGDWGQDPKGAAGTLVVEGEQNCGPVDAGYYVMNVDLGAMTWSVTPITTIGIVGSGVGSWDNDVPMTYDKAEGCWTVTTTFVAGAIKFRANNGWDYNWGGTTDALTQGGADIAVEAGTYTIKLWALCDGYAQCTIDKI